MLGTLTMPQQDASSDTLLQDDDHDQSQDIPQLETAPATTSAPVTAVGAPPPKWDDIKALPEFNQSSPQRQQDAFNTWIGQMHSFGEANDYKPNPAEADQINQWGAKQARDLGMATFVDPLTGIVQPINTGQIQDSLVRFGKGVGTVMGQGLAGLAHNSRYLNPDVWAQDIMEPLAKQALSPDEYKKYQANLNPVDITGNLEQAGRTLENKSNAIPVNPLLNNSAEAKVSEFLGSVVPMVAMGGAGGTALLAGSMGQQGAEKAEAMGFSPERQELTRGVDTAMGVALGKLAETVPWLREADSATALKQALTQSTGSVLLRSLARNSARDAAAGAVQNVPEQISLGQNPLSKDSLSEDAENALTLGIGGGLLGTALKGAGIASAKGIIREQWNDENDIRKDADQPQISYQDYVAKRLVQLPTPKSEKIPSPTTGFVTDNQPQVNPLDAMNAKLEVEINKQETVIQEDKNPETMPATHPVFGEGDYKPADLLGKMTTSDVAPSIQQLLWNDLPTDRVRRVTTDDQGKQSWQYDFATPNEVSNENFQRPQLTKDNLGRQDVLKANQAEVSAAQAVGTATTGEITNAHDEEQKRESESRQLFDETELGKGPSDGSAGELGGDGGGIGRRNEEGISGAQPQGSSASASPHEADVGVTGEGGSAEATTPLTPRKTAPATYLGEQEQAGGKPSIPLYNLNEDIEGHSKGSTVSGDTLTKAGYDLPEKSDAVHAQFEEEGFKEDDGVWIDPKTKDLPEDQKGALDNFTKALRDNGIRGMRIKLSNAERGIWARPSVDRKTIFVNPDDIARIRQSPRVFKAATSEEYWHDLHGEVANTMGRHRDVSTMVFGEMSPESVSQTVGSYQDADLKKRFADGKLTDSDKVVIASEYLRMLQMRLSGEKTIEQIRGVDKPDSEQTKNLLSVDQREYSNSPNIGKILSEATKLDMAARPQKYENTKTSENLSGSSQRSTSDNTGTKGEGGLSEHGRRGEATGERESGQIRDGEEPQAIHAGLGLPEPIKQLAADLNTDVRGIKKYDAWTKLKNVFSADLQNNPQEVRAVTDYVRKIIPDSVRREGITNYLEAGADVNVLRARMDATKDKDLKAGYESALNLSSEEKQVAQGVRRMYDNYRDLGIKWGVNIGRVENYVNHAWKDKNNPDEGLKTAGGKRLQTSFKYSRERKLPTYFEGEQLGYKPQIKDISNLLGAYVNDLNYAILSRKFIKGLSEGKAADGRPLVAPKFGGMSHLAEESEGKNPAVLIYKGNVKEEHGDYHDTTLPVLSNWVWKGQVDSKMILAKDNMAIHPEIASELKNIFGKSGLRSWWDEPSQSTGEKAFKAILKTVDRANKIARTTLLAGVPTAFHPVQIGMEALSHASLTFKIKEPDLSDPDTYDAVAHGLQLLPNENSRDQFMSGKDQLRDNALVIATRWLTHLGGDKTTLAKVGDKIDRGLDFVQRWIFETFIPSQKLAYYQKVLPRNMVRFKSELDAGIYTPDDIKYLTSHQANGSFGHLNYIDMARNPTLQHALQFALLAPDFAEARNRIHTGQVIQGALGGKGGYEQGFALAAMSTGIFVGTRLINSWLNNGDPKYDHPFSIVIGNKAYNLRFQGGDIYRLTGVPWENGKFSWRPLFSNWRSWVSGRESPMARFASEALTGVNYRGEPTSLADAIRDTLVSAVPIPIQPLLTPTVHELPAEWQSFVAPKNITNNPISPWEQMLGALGVQVSRYSPITSTYQLAASWKAQHASEYGLPAERGIYPTSPYMPIKYALDDGDYQLAQSEYQQLLATDKGNVAKVTSGLRKSLQASFTGTLASERAFEKSLSPNDLQTFEAAKDRKQLLWQRFQQMRSQMSQGLSQVSK